MDGEGPCRPQSAMNVRGYEKQNKSTIPVFDAQVPSLSSVTSSILLIARPGKGHVAKHIFQILEFLSPEGT